MRCPFCEAEKESLKVIDSRTCDGGKSIRRRRECEKCGNRFTTYERVERASRLMVVKKSGDRVPFDRNKILAGLEHACYKRPVSDDDKRRIVDEVEEQIHTAHDREVNSSAIGEAVMNKLRRVDNVAYVRFASVYRNFKTLEELVEESKAVIDARRFEDPPGQGRLFVEPPTESRQAPAADAEGENGERARRRAPRAMPAARRPVPVRVAEG